MRRVPHHLLSLSIILSSFLCAAVCITWARSYGLTDQLTWRRTDGERSIRSARGQVLVAMYLWDRSNEPAEWFGLRYARGPARTATEELITPLFLSHEPGDATVRYDRVGFTWHELRNARRGTATILGAVPFWSLALLAGALPLAWATSRGLAHLRGRRRLRRGLCPTCAYDLRATPDQTGTLLDRCPECGRPTTNALPPKQRLSTMTRIRPLATFAAGFAAATALAFLLLVPVSNQSVRDEIQRDVNDPLWATIYYASQSANNRDCATATAQLKMVTERFAAYSSGNGPAPSHWWKDVVNHKAAPAPATQPAVTNQ